MKRIRCKGKVYGIISWKELDKLVEILSNKVKLSNYKVDVIVGILKGGLVIASLLSDSLSTDKVACIGIRRYKIVGKPLSSTVKYQNVSKRLVKNKNVLVVDDVCETGQTLKIAYDDLISKNVKEVRSACIHLKPHSKFMPDYYSKKVKLWIIYPYEIKCFLKVIQKKIPYL